MTGLSPGTVPTSNYVSHYDPTKNHHRAWLQAVLERLVQHEPEALAEGSELRDLWKAAVETKAHAPAVLRHPNPLVGVPRFSQRDSAQLRALAHFGITARLEQSADFQLIEQQINRGIPVPCGYIHRGPVDWPTGSGHWLIVYGHTPTHVVVNDPWGEPDLVSGTTLNAKGMGLSFSRLNFGKRWMVEPIGGGAYRYAPGRGWAVVVDRVG